MILAAPLVSVLHVHQLAQQHLCRDRYTAAEQHRQCDCHSCIDVSVIRRSRPWTLLPCYENSVLREVMAK